MNIPFQEEISEILIRQVLEENEETGSDKPVRNGSAWSGILLNHPFFFAFPVDFIERKASLLIKLFYFYRLTTFWLWDINFDKIFLNFLHL